MTKKLLGVALCGALVLPSGPASAELLKNLKLMGGLDIQNTSARNVADFRTRTSVAGLDINDSGAVAGAAEAANGHDRVGDTLTRTWVGLNWDLLDDVHARATLVKNDRPWGTAGGAAGGAGQTPATGLSQSAIGGAGGAGDIASNVFIQEANVKIDKLGGHVDTTVGRQFYGDPGDIIAFWGPKNNYGLFVTAIDALRIDWSHDWVNVTGIAGRVSGTGATLGAATGNPTDIRGLDVGWKGLPVKANTFIYNRVIHRGTGATGLGTAPTNAAAGAVNDNLWVYGLKLKGEAMGGWLGLTAALNGGETRAAAASAATAYVARNEAGGFVTVGEQNPQSGNYVGKALHLSAGYKADLPDMAALTPWLEWGWGSGRSSTIESPNDGFQGIAPDYAPGIIYGRFQGANAAGVAQSAQALGNGQFALGGVPLSQPGLQNRIIWGLGMDVTPAAWNKLTGKISFWDFSYQRATYAQGGAINADDGLRAQQPRSQGNRHIGSEFDLEFKWNHSENVMVGLGWATFQPGGFVKEAIKAANSANQVAAISSDGHSSPITMAFADISVKF